MDAHNTIIPVILAGGQGTRLWPASLPDIPKQFIKIAHKSLMLQAIERALAVSTQEVIIVTGKTYATLFPALLKEELTDTETDLSSITFLCEPAPRNTAPAIALAAQYVQQKYYKDSTRGSRADIQLLVITADHLITPAERFVKDVRHASTVASMTHAAHPHGRIVTFGIPPTRAETGYGYIEAGARITEHGQDVNAFKEKPDIETAKRYCAHGGYYWNSGMFCFPLSLLISELHTHCTQLYESIFHDSTRDEEGARIQWKRDTAGGCTLMHPQNIDFDVVTNISIDYAVMEHTAHAAVVSAQFEWNDVGSWDEAITLLSQGDDTARVYTVESENVSVYSDIPVGVSGLSDVTIVMKNNRLLVMKKDTGQNVTEIAKLDKRH